MIDQEPEIIWYSDKSGKAYFFSGDENWAARFAQEGVGDIIYFFATLDTEVST